VRDAAGAFFSRDQTPASFVTVPSDDGIGVALERVFGPVPLFLRLHDANHATPRHTVVAKSRGSDGAKSHG